MRRVNQQVQNYKTCLKNSHFGVEKFNFSLGLSFGKAANASLHNKFAFSHNRSL